MMRNIVSFIVLIVLVVILSGAKIERAPGSVSRPPVPTYGYVVFTIPLQRQGTDEEDQFALWLETAEGQHFKTLANSVTTPKVVVEAVTDGSVSRKIKHAARLVICAGCS